MIQQSTRLFTALAAAMALSACLGSSDSPDTDTMPGDMQPPPEIDTTPTAAEWETAMDGLALGVSHAGYGLLAEFDVMGMPSLTASSPMNQPTVSGTWSGNWSARYTALGSDSGALDASDDGTATIAVTLDGTGVEAVLTYSGIDIPGLSASVSTPAATVTDGRFEPSVTVDVPTSSGTTVASTFSGAGQFGGANQNGVAGHMSGEDFRSVFYGDRDE